MVDRAGGTVLGVWQYETASALLYGLGLILAEFVFTRLRIKLAARRVGLAAFARFLVLSFLARLTLYLAWIGLALRLFGRHGRLIVCLLAVSSVPLGIVWTHRGRRSGRDGDCPRNP